MAQKLSLRHDSIRQYEVQPCVLEWMEATVRPICERSGTVGTRAWYQIASMADEGNYTVDELRDLDPGYWIRCPGMGPKTMAVICEVMGVDAASPDSVMMDCETV